MYTCAYGADVALAEDLYRGKGQTRIRRQEVEAGLLYCSTRMPRSGSVRTGSTVVRYLVLVLILEILAHAIHTYIDDSVSGSKDLTCSAVKPVCTMATCRTDDQSRSLS